MRKQLILLSVLVWMSYLLFWFLAIVVLLVGFLLIKTKRFKTMLFATLLSPLVIVPLFSFTFAVIGYFEGSAKFHYASLPSFEFFNLDRQYRAYKATSGCLVDGGEFLQHAPNNFALKLMIENFGYMKGSYQGAYPNKEEIQKLLREAKVITFEQLKSHYRFNENSLQDISHYLNGDNNSSFKLKLYRLNNECLILQNDNTLLIDLKNSKIFAKYRLRWQKISYN
ncbi:MAG: hypothetical protein JXQ76_10030 [Campylobacterales bacterium]|nr:hypothetical protein [Campylobacterales bacterium]